MTEIKNSIYCAGEGGFRGAGAARGTDDRCRHYMTKKQEKKLFVLGVERNEKLWALRDRLYEKLMKNKRKKVMENLKKAGWKGK